MKRTGRIISPRAQRIRRSRGARVLIVATVVFLSSALYRLQVVQGEQYALTARENRLRELPVPAPRGTIYDRTGRVVAENVPGYIIQVMPGDAMEPTIEELTPLLGLTEDQINRARRRWQRQRHLPMELLYDAPETAVAAVAERRHQFPNVLVHQYAKRRYPAGEAIAHFIGYVNEINDRQLASPDFEGYRMGQWVGQAGLERQYEQHLGGTPGSRYLEVDAWGRIKRWLPEEMGRPSVPGRDLHLHLDLDLQEYIHAIWPEGQVGSMVALDPATGGVLAYYSYPTYDPNLWIGGISQTDYDRLYNDPELPLLDRVVGSRTPAASTWKLAVAGMALDLGVIRPDEYMPQACTGSYFYGRTARCWYAPGHGRQNLILGIQNSCNVYFYQVGVRIGLERFMETGTRMGFGNRTGIDVPHEIQPTFPGGLDYYRTRFGYTPYDNEVLSLAIGQGPTEMTVIKLAHIYAALTAPNGKVPEPRLAKGVPADTFEFRTTARDRWYLEAGMRQVTAPGGTAGRSRVPVWDFIGKTGTAQVPPRPSHGWFVGTGAREPGAPPEIAITMFTAHAESGAIASGIVGEAVNFYLSRKYGREFRLYVTPRIASLHNYPHDASHLNLPVVHPPMPPAEADDRRDPSQRANPLPGSQQADPNLQPGTGQPRPLGDPVGGPP
ncbi:MAG TPA: penicillin-binding protein 2 [Longimicrobiales bacterium]|nr:penicillin-binding protein 2 [Longimicrobiales bacterium]